ncbi:hypothetical protein CEUSTIGMA_g7166.t1 [Chlamydomonas eustigma]|uniref:Cilia- and flagella-associated protein 53 n=1 Tax=Chlamydomonas eustigma TaxID=1157962 RepID=A0A250X9F8_9CHLO|nr:hypothetical protein CEUSTIGMA_g7166.t1 [Chlamydomonas eustigma]|eukprot:GAX79725.1 hypothetical protein CEUSTIGMA_g7166.t1 [Chlamydomonas eustigma]
MAKQSRGIAALAAQSKLREYEARLQEMNINESKRVSSAIQWQMSSDAKLRSNIVKQRFEELRQRREVDLDARRARLASKLMREDAQLKQELIDSQETPEQRRAKLADRARALAGKREAERQQLAASLYERAFQEDCDVLRETNSKRVLYRTLEERTAQIEQKMAAKIIEEEEKRMFHEMNEQERLKSIQRHVDDQRKIMEQRLATTKVLEEQVRAVNLRREEEAAARKQEIEELRQLWEAMAQEQEQQDAMEKEQMKALASELFEFNRLRKMEMSEKDRMERELDLKILQDALVREANDEQKEAEAKAKRKEDMRHYREQLSIMMAQEAENGAEREAMIQAEFDRQQRQADAEMAAREAARQRLMEQVDAIRQEQIRYKQQQRRDKYLNRDAELAALAEDEARATQEEGRKLADTRKRNLIQKLEVQTQMVAKAHIRAAEEDEKLRALEVAKATEKAYMAKVQETVANSYPPQWFGHKKVNWYT